MIAIRIKNGRGQTVWSGDLPEASVIVEADRGIFDETGELEEHIALKVYDRAVFVDYGGYGRNATDITSLTIARAKRVS
jgi:hypothetical protein